MLRERDVYSVISEVVQAGEDLLRFSKAEWPDLLQNGLAGSPCSPRDSQESTITLHSKPPILQCSAFFAVQLSHDYWKNHSLD